MYRKMSPILILGHIYYETEKQKGVVHLSLSLLKSIFENLGNCNRWSLQLLKISNSKRNGTTYLSRQIDLHPSDKQRDLINAISSMHLGNGKNPLNGYREVREYDGTADALVVYKLSTHDELIRDEYPKLLQAISNPNVEADPFAYGSAYLLTGEILFDAELVSVKLVSMQNPVTVLKNKFAYSNGTFHELSDKVLSLRPIMDVVIVGNSVYFLSLAGENLFNMARSYKVVCHKDIEIIEQSEIVYGMEQFSAIAESGHNPRRFVSFNKERLNELKKRDVRMRIANKFSIPLDASGDKFDATVTGASEKLVKLLCNKGMTDPFLDTAVEVDGARKWQ